MSNRKKIAEIPDMPVLHKTGVSRRCWIVGADVDTGNIRPAYVTKKDAAELQVKGYEDYQSCLDEANRVAAEWGRTCG